MSSSQDYVAYNENNSDSGRFNDEILVYVSGSPDLSISMPLPPNTPFKNGEVRYGYVQVTNVGSAPTTGTVTFRISAPANFSFSIPDTSSLSWGEAPLTVATNNGDWRIVPPGFFYSVTHKILPGVTPDIPAGGNVKIGFRITATGPGGSTGNCTLTVINGTGGDNNTKNSSGTRQYSID